jgi:hypothetical protein
VDDVDTSFRALTWCSGAATCRRSCATRGSSASAVYAFAQGASADRGLPVPGVRARRSRTGRARVPTDGAKNGHFYRITAHTTGITGSTEPTWPTGAGATVVDGGVTWTESGSTSITAGTPVETVIQQILDDNIGGITLNTPVSPSWSIKGYKVDRSNVWDAVKKLADQIGWDLRYKWDSGSSSFKLTLYTPNRANTTADRTFTSAQRYPLTKLTTQVQWIRNAVQVVYSDSADLDANKIPKRKTVVRTDATSISSYGRRFCEVAESDASNIDSSTEANALADAILSDLANPVAEHECEVPLFRHVELSDLYQWNSDALHYDSNQKLAVTGYAHKITGTSARTTIETRGKPSTGFRRWHGKIDADMHALDLANVDQTTVTTTDGVGGTRIQITPNTAETKGGLPVEHDVHVSASAGFTPSSANLVAQGANTSLTVHDLIPGKTYYGKVRPKGHNRSRPVLSGPTAEFSFVAGQASAGHLKDGIAVGDYPLNGGFETRLDTGDLPDHWTLYSGVYGTNVSVIEDGNGISGNRYLRLLGGGVRSASFPMLQEACESSRRGSLYRFHWWRKAGSSASAYSALVRELDYTGAEVSIITVGSSMPVTHAGHWVREELFCRLKEGDASARTLQLQISGGGTGANQQIEIDEVRCQYLGSPWYEVGDTTYFTENYEAIPGFSGAWANYTTTSKVAFRKDQFGRVELKGFAATGAIPSAMFTLPLGFRPAELLSFAVDSTSAYGNITISTAGVVSVIVGNNFQVSLNGISFMTTKVANTTT